MEDKQQILDKDFENLFKGFKPELSSNDSFLKDLDRSLRAVDMVREEVQELRHKNFIALGVAFLAGLFVGVGLSFLFPFVIEWSLTFFAPNATIDGSSFKVNWHIMGWLLIAVTCIFTAKNAYDIALYKLTHSVAKRGE